MGGRSIGPPISLTVLSSSRHPELRETMGVLAMQRRMLQGSVALAAVSFAACSGDEPLQPGQTGEVWGTAFDASSGGTLSGVAVSVGGKSTQTGSNGQYVLAGVPPGQQSLTATKDGYLEHTAAIPVVAGDTTFINVSLAPDRGPAGLTAESGSPGQIHLSWTPRATVESYNLYWSTSPGVTPAAGTLIAGIQGTSYDHSGLNPGTKYYYVVAVVNDGVEGPLSAEVSATAGNGIVLKVRDPGAGFVADTNIQATVIVTSVFQLTSVTATVEDRTTGLSFQSSVNNWHGRVSLTGLPSPRPRTVTFTATDVNGTVATASQSFEHNRRAVVTIESPLPGTVIQSPVRLRVTCTDDVPSGCANLKIGAATGDPSPISQDIADGVTHFDQDASLALFDGREVIIGAEGTDDLGRQSFAVIVAHVDLSPRLVKVAEVNGIGTVIDASIDRLLVLDTISNRDTHTGTLKIQQRGTGQTTAILTGKSLVVQPAHLTRRGAVFRAHIDGTNSIDGLEWRDNVLLDLGNLNAFAIDQPYLGWSVFQGAIYRRNLESGGTIVVPAEAGDHLSDVGPNGDVIFRTPSSEIKRFRDGVISTIVPLDPDPNVRNGGGLTDGVNVCYSTKTRTDVGALQLFHNLLALTDAGVDTLVIYQVPLDADEFRAEPACLVSGGWIAYTKPSSGGTVQIWARDPAGTHTQVSFFSGLNTLEELAPDGRVVFRTPPFYAPRRYLWAPGGGAASEIGSGFGRPLFIDGQLHVALGNALLRVN
jgi:hypothetical protein